jgi:hypothetical protein
MPSASKVGVRSGGMNLNPKRNAAYSSQQQARFR